MFVNPPFSAIGYWVAKCYQESKNGFTVVMIIPPRSDTVYWHSYIMKADELRFCVGRVNFLRDGKKPKHGCTYPLVIVVFKDNARKNPKVSSYHHKWYEKI